MYAEQGFQYIEMMSGNDLVSDPAGQEALMDWVEEAGMNTIPVLDAHNFEHWGAFELDFGTPSITHIGPDLRILSFDDGLSDPSSFLDNP